MCFGGGTPKYEPSSAPAVTPAPAAAPLPSPNPTETESSISSAERRRRIQAVRYGMLSTIKTSPTGITGRGADLISADTTGKKTLGA